MRSAYLFFVATSLTFHAHGLTSIIFAMSLFLRLYFTSFPGTPEEFPGGNRLSQDKNCPSISNKLHLRSHVVLNCPGTITDPSDSPLETGAFALPKQHFVM